MHDSFKKIIFKAAENLQSNQAFILATVLESIGGTPCRSGFKMIIYNDGSTEGTVGGGLIEQRVKKEALALFNLRENKLLQFDLNTALSSGNSPTKNQYSKLDMQCGGEAKIFLEFYAPARTAYLFGAGHLCQSMLPLLQSLDFHTVVIDNRSEYADLNRLAQANQVICAEYLEFSRSFAPSPQDAVIIFTHAHTNDYDILYSICQRTLPLKYIGMIASSQKASQNLAQLKEMGISKNIVASIHTPIGLNIAKTTTSEIAVSIAAELLAVYNNINTIKSLSR